LPSQDEVKYARRIVEAFEKAQATGLGTLSFEGKMIDYMTYKQAKNLVQFAKVIAEKEKRRQAVPYVSLSRFFVSGS